MPCVSKCELCCGVEIEVIQKGVRHASEIEVVCCKNCGLVFCNPLPTGQDLKHYYAEYYTRDYGKNPVPDRYVTGLDEARVRVRRLLPYLDPGCSVLEVGAGAGSFLNSVQPYIGRIKGLEPDKNSCEWIRQNLGLDVCSSIQDVNRQGEKFDLVVLFHVLEHIRHPVQFLLDLTRILNDSGKIVVEVPNIDDVLVAVYRVPEYLSYYYQKAHLWYFSTKTLTMAFGQAGLSVDVLNIQRYDLSNHLRWMLTGKPGGKGYYNTLLSESVNAAYADALVRAGHGDTLWAVTSPKFHTKE